MRLNVIKNWNQNDRETRKECNFGCRSILQRKGLQHKANGQPEADFRTLSERETVYMSGAEQRWEEEEAANRESKEGYDGRRKRLLKDLRENMRRAMKQSGEGEVVPGMFCGHNGRDRG